MKKVISLVVSLMLCLGIFAGAYATEENIAVESDSAVWEAASTVEPEEETETAETDGIEEVIEEEEAEIAEMVETKENNDKDTAYAVASAVTLEPDYTINKLLETDMETGSMPGSLSVMITPSEHINGVLLPGEIFTAKVGIHSGTAAGHFSVTHMGFAIEFDGQALELVNFNDEGAIGTAMSAPKIALSGDDGKTVKYYFDWLSVDGTPIEIAEHADALILELSFKIREGARAGEYPIKIKDAYARNFDMVNFVICGWYAHIYGASISVERAGIKSAFNGNEFRIEAYSMDTAATLIISEYDSDGKFLTSEIVDVEKATPVAISRSYPMNHEIVRTMMLVNKNWVPLCLSKTLNAVVGYKEVAPAQYSPEAAP